MPRLRANWSRGLALICAVAACCLNAATAQSPKLFGRAVPAGTKPSTPTGSASPQASSADDICRTLAQAAADNDLPAQFFARVIWQESRFNARAVSPKGAEGIAQFMPQTANWRGLANPFDPIAALHEAAAYLRELRDQFGNIGLAAAAYNAGPGRVNAWLHGQGSLPGETRNYVGIITGYPADEWTSASPPELSETTIPQGAPCTVLANLVLAPKQEARRIAAYVPRWGAQLTSNWSESRAWATYRSVEHKYGNLIGDREPIVLHQHIAGLGIRARYIIRIADDSRAYLEKLCGKINAAGGACVVLPNKTARS